MIRAQRNGREVLSTGKVDIGLLYEPQPQRDPGVHAEAIQRALTAPEPPREWHEHPRQFYVAPSWWRRALNLWSNE